MIITVFSQDESSKRSILAANLAAHCALHYRKVLLIDATAPHHALGWSACRDAAGIKSKLVVRGAENLQSELENPASYSRSHYAEIVIDADGANTQDTDAALVATDVLLVPVHARQGEMHNLAALAERIDTLKLFNPTLRVLVAEVQPISAFGDTQNSQSNPARQVANSILTAVLANTVILEWIDDRSTFQQGRSAMDCSPRNQRAVAEIQNLYQEIAKTRTQRLDPVANSRAILQALQRRTEEKELCHISPDIASNQASAM
ncbi:cobQ/CobB/MinD/ParA nucleotide binding domain protein [Collimonas arenae]|uniref:CobQ/CobB/MinD/ParA nucleotide binding domain protein n=1 Tax=Collimonas arenae TaxID=279058 RepID=A0A127PK21_9BURK|nr:hypothetical protein [Collimonas arenae]AMO98159.1 cobQ/CobB/MinD/ParA nucleotide binding domain protein [Collimonas arenae]AMP08029.1 cobQ/CobB/MinD/ParA nucleotide binding domain protein [Collimonas arenae]